MKTSTNEISLDYRNNPDLKEIFSRKKIGDKCVLEIELQVNEMTDDGVKGSIKSVTSPDDYDTEDKPKKAEPTAEEPVMAVMSAGSSA